VIDPITIRGAIAVSHGNDGRHDFDFLHGTWNNYNRKLKERLVGCIEWDEFEATGSCFATLGGLGNIDNFLPTIEGNTFEAMSIRIFNPETRLWSIWWGDNNACTLFPPVHGRFVDGVGEFRGTDIQDGAPVDVRYLWTNITPTSAKWEQAMSTDSGQTWEPNWEMHFTRVS